MEFLKTIINRRSIRKFSNKQVPVSKLKEIVDAGRYAPKASNRQHWEAIIVTSNAVIEDLYERAGAQQTILSAPALVAIILDKKFNDPNNDGIQSASAAVQNMLLKAYTVGIGSCWIGAVGDKKIASDVLSIPPDFEVMCYILFGYPDEKISFVPPKKELSEIIHFERYTKKTSYLPSDIKTKNWSIEEIKKHQIFLSRARGLGFDYEIYSEEEIKKISDLIKDNIQKDSKILFMYSYDGTILKNLKSELCGHNIFDCELDKEIINFMKVKADFPKYFVYNTEDYTNYFDFVIYLFTLEKFPNKEELLISAYKLLKKDGHALIFFKNKFSFYGLGYNFVYYFLCSKLSDSYSSSPFEPTSFFFLKKNLKKIGFKIINFAGLFFVSPELKIYIERVDGYLKRHKRKLSLLRFFIKPLLLISVFLSYLTNWIKYPYICSTSFISAKK